jgi:hypothetical protein
MPGSPALYSLIMSVIKAKSPKTIIREIIEIKNIKDKKILSLTTAFSFRIIVKIAEKWKIIISIIDIPAYISVLLISVFINPRLIVLISILTYKIKL